MTKTNGGFCVMCGHKVNSFDGLSKCPSCESTFSPCANKYQFDVNINWHELHILAVWAENWQRDKKLPKVVYPIIKRIKEQYPHMPPLTLAEELGQVAASHSIATNNPKLREDIAEQTGREIILIDKSNFEPDDVEDDDSDIIY